MTCYLDPIKAFFTFALILALTLISCSRNDESNGEMPSEIDPLIGVWELVELRIVSNGDTSLVIQDNTRQFKIYTDDYFMWNRNVPGDSAEWHTFGTYRLFGDSLIETPMVYSGAMEAFLQVAGMKEFRIQIELGRDEFRQVLYNPISKVYNIQLYRRIE